MDLDIAMTFPAGSIFTFGSWVCTTDDYSKLQNHLVEITADRTTPTTRQNALEDLVKKIGEFSILDPTPTQNQLKQF
jgi:hypothetical protein